MGQEWTGCRAEWSAGWWLKRMHERGFLTRSRVQRLSALRNTLRDDDGRLSADGFTLHPNDVVVCGCSERFSPAGILEHGCPSLLRPTETGMDLLLFGIKRSGGALDEGREMEERRGVYVISNGRGAVKIGKTFVSAKTRLTEARIWNAEPVELVAMLSGSGNDEKDIHRHLAEYHVSGEWFREVGEVVQMIDDAKRGRFWGEDRLEAMRERVAA